MGGAWYFRLKRGELEPAANLSSNARHCRHSRLVPEPKYQARHRPAIFEFCEFCIHKCRVYMVDHVACDSDYWTENLKLWVYPSLLADFLRGMSTQVMDYWQSIIHYSARKNPIIHYSVAKKTIIPMQIWVLFTLKSCFWSLLRAPKPIIHYSVHQKKNHYSLFNSPWPWSKSSINRYVIRYIYLLLFLHWTTLSWGDLHLWKLSTEFLFFLFKIFPLIVLLRISLQISRNFFTFRFLLGSSLKSKSLRLTDLGVWLNCSYKVRHTNLNAFLGARVKPDNS